MLGAAGHRVLATDFVTVGQANGRPVVDVRQKIEYVIGHIPGAPHVELGHVADLAEDIAPTALIACGHGERAMTAAGLLERLGYHDPAVLNGDPDDLSNASGQPLADGE